MQKSSDVIGSSSISGVGIQCHSSLLVIRSKRLKDLLQLHPVNLPEAEKEDAFWGEIQALRAMRPAVWFPDYNRRGIAVVHRNNSDTPPIDKKSLDIIERAMKEKGFIGFMIPGGVLVLKTGNPVFKKTCNSLGFPAVI